MVARTPSSKEKRRATPPLSPSRAREIVKKVREDDSLYYFLFLNPMSPIPQVDKCVARLQELQYTVAGGNKVVAGSSLSPRSTRGYLRTSLRCKQETMRMKSSARRPAEGEWKGMSLQAMLVGETVKEILQAKERVAGPMEPKTPLSVRRRGAEMGEFRARRKREKEYKGGTWSKSPPARKAKGKIGFKSPSPSPPRLKVAITKKTVMFPNAVFSRSPPSSSQSKFCKRKSPVSGKTRQCAPHRFLIKSPAPPLKSSQRSPVRVSAKAKVAMVTKLRRSFSPARLASRLAAMSPLRSRASKSESGRASK